MKSRRSASASALANDDFLRPAAVLVIGLGAEGGDLELLPAFDDDHHAEFSSDGDGLLEKFLDLFRPRVRGDVKILRLASEQKIAHTTADPKGGKAGGLQAPDNFQGGIQAATKSASSGLPFLKRLTPRTLNPMTRPPDPPVPSRRHA